MPKIKQINLLEYEKNNLYSYKTNAVNLGIQKIDLDENNVHRYAYIASVSILENLIT